MQDIKGDREFIFSEYDIKGVIHFAAESHVDNSIKNPGVFVQTNTLVDVAKKYWMEKPFTYKDGTLSLDPNDLFTEKTSYAPSSDM